MGAGLQVWGDHGLYQIDGENKQITLYAKGTLYTSPVPGTYPQYSGASVPVAAGMILAVASASPFTIMAKHNGIQDVVVQGVAGSTVNYWVFSPHVPSGTRVGMEVYGATGELIFDTGRPPMRHLATVEGSGTASGFPADRTLALAVWQQSVSVRRWLGMLGPATPGFYPDYMMAVDVTAGFVRPLGGGQIEITDRNYFVDQTGPWPGYEGAYPLHWEGEWANGLSNKYAVIDVTGI